MSPPSTADSDAESGPAGAPNTDTTEDVETPDERAIADEGTGAEEGTGSGDGTGVEDGTGVATEGGETGAPAPELVPPFVPTIPEPTLAHRLSRRRGRGARFAYRVVNRVERRRLQSRSAFRLPRDGSIELHRLAGLLRWVEVGGGVYGSAAARSNRDIVIDVCEAAGIPYFAVPEPAARRYRIGVEQRFWLRLIAALEEHSLRRPVYLGVLARADNGRRRRWVVDLADPLAGRAAREQRVLEVFRFRSNGAARPFDRPWACVVDRWDSDDAGTLRAPTRNARTSYLGRHAQQPAVIPQGGRRVATFEAFADRNIFDVDFPIDIVYMWVDGADPAWAERKVQALDRLGANGGTTPTVAAADERFRDGGELRYSLRSVEAFAPWVRRIFLVTDRQRPSWLNLEHPKLTLVDHREVFGNAGTLPSFNSHAIGARLHHIEGLSEHYLHFNDDVFLGREMGAQAFFHSTGVSRFFLSRSTLPFNDEAEPHEAARRNVVDLLKRDFGRSPTRTFFHTPIAQRRSTMFELEDRYPDEFHATWNSQFRASTDYEINSWLHHYYGYLTGKAAPSRIMYDYFALDDAAARRRMRVLQRRRNVQVFCINDSAETTDAQRDWAADWLARYYGRQSEFELPSS